MIQLPLISTSVVLSKCNVMLLFIMKITLVTHGSRGDTQPFALLAIALQDRGNDVRLCGLGDQKEFCERYGVKHFYGMETTAAELFEEAKEFICGNFDLAEFMEALGANREARFRAESVAVLKACEGADLILYHGTVEPIVFSLHEQYNIPIACVMLIPWKKTNEFPPPVLSLSQMPAEEENLKAWEDLFAMLYPPTLDMINRWRKETFGLGQMGIIPEEEKGLFVTPYDYLQSKFPYIMLYSQFMIPFPQDWDATLAHQASYVMLPPSLGGWKPSNELELFLDPSLPAPVYIGFGSMIHKDPETLLRTVLGAIQISGNRAIICEGWYTLGKPDNFNPNEYGLRKDLNQILFVYDIPHTWLFPRCCVSIIHGGAGTTAAAARSGKPVIVCPFLVDQPTLKFWSLQCQKQGISPPVTFDAQSVTTENLSEAIIASQSSDILLAAKKMGENLCSEDGLALAISCIEKLCSSNAK